MKRSFPYIRITKKQEKTVQTGHPWIYEDEITEQSEQIKNGSIVDVLGSKGQYLGSGLYSEASKIKVRILHQTQTKHLRMRFLSAASGMPSAIGMM